MSSMTDSLKADHESLPSHQSAAAILLLGIPLWIALYGLVSGGGTFSRANILDIVCVIGAFVLGRRIVRRNWGIAFLLIAYVAIKLLYMVVSDGLLLADFVQSYKMWVLVAAVAVASGKRALGMLQTARWARMLIWLYFLGYAYQVVVLNYSRPTLITENNFELCLVLGAFVITRTALGASAPLYFILLASTVALSGSRSGVVELGLVYLVCFVSPRRPSFVFHVAGTYAFFLLATEIFSRRSASAGGQTIDRVRFFDYFKIEVSDWDLLHWLLGNPPLTPLSRATCSGLSFYSDLFSRSDPDVCYPVILHSGIMRTILDNGLLGLVALYLVVMVLLLRAGVPRRVSFALTGIGLLNSFSVSGFNNSLCVLPLLIAVFVHWDSPPVAMGVENEGQIESRDRVR